MTRDELIIEMKSAQWSKDRCVEFAVRCAMSLVPFAPSPVVLETINKIDDYRKSGFPDSESRAVDKMVQPIAKLRIKNQGKEREVCHATLHAAECALAGLSSIYAQCARSWAAVNAADTAMAHALLVGEF